MGNEERITWKTGEILKKYGVSLRKSLGQNFLIDPNMVKKIAESAHLESEDGVIEIGPGVGVLTAELAKRAKKVVAVEIDGRLIPILSDIFRDWKSIRIIHGDILKINLHEITSFLLQETKRVHVVANLPYYVTTPILMRLLEDKLPLTSIVVMVQREVADRIAAEPGGKEYGALSIACQYFAKVEKVLQVPKEVFYPKPEVDSTVIRLMLYAFPPVRVEEENLFFQVVRASFANRRKTLFNNLRSAFPELEQNLSSLLSEGGIDPKRRGETLTIQEFSTLSNLIWRERVKKRGEKLLYE
ncbi:16S rRNA (adenine(1518)-N(6)/adenine(1519)-N(6))-dimethyltransferase RsmA [Thermicanus aegyptius]|uniref:16S rRNA (adenine(1518)-N(6)/adenine(1519)-N(6))- dimethyltransferase RsmA n=1 Tax=Thermicanus aegyptius TaxID=94009 RepID=UPI00040EC27B|nr:16S rRNA (adenine(1518)-N(6)/adenine(1519)-N(6))-dimethyltransferase RsmA [Thermicanus aegyptius]